MVAYREGKEIFVLGGIKMKMDITCEHYVLGSYEEGRRSCQKINAISGSWVLFISLAFSRVLIGIEVAILNTYEYFE